MNADARIAQLQEKYRTRAPRYTSYPTAPHFRALGDDEARAAAARAGARPLSVYAHIPFCKTLCLYCGCSVEIQGRREVGTPYVDMLLREIDLWVGAGLEGSTCDQLALGGGTPTFLLPSDMARLVHAIDAAFPPTADGERAIEVDPRTVSPETLDQLLDLGFRRLSFGVQDFDEAVLAAVKRPQSYSCVEGHVRHMQQRGLGEINLDLMYGLPGQTTATFGPTLEKVLALGPSRIALFLYAHVPWLKPAQKLLEARIPAPDERTRIFELATRVLTDAGYVPVGMDHFALPDDPLVRAQEAGTLHRNFMGYTTRRGRDMLGVGVSSIGLLGGAYLQSYKPRGPWSEAIAAGRLPTERGHVMTPEDSVRRDIILDLFCNFQTTMATDLARQVLASASARLAPMIEDGLVEVVGDDVRVTATGRGFIRSVCGAFDAFLEADVTARRYSQTA